MTDSILNSIPKSLRGTPSLRPFYGRKHVVIVCDEDPSTFEAAADQLRAMNAALVLEREAGPLSAVLGRPSVTACDRYLDVGLRAEHAEVARVIEALRGFDMRCEECPQAADEVGSPWLAAREVRT
ncbi:MAG TPA: hypothetical protein VK988_11540 [Acidimicrobiales bacterium]|nr:hypothetical protein [Acidimicrobiales bacterium]